MNHEPSPLYPQRYVNALNAEIAKLREERFQWKLALDAETEIRSRLHDVLERAGEKITELSAMVRALSEPQRRCGGCGFLLGVSRVCLTEGCGNDYSNDPRAFSELEVDQP